MKKLLLVSLCFLFFSSQIFAQSRTITGTVTAKEDGVPIPGVSIKVVGTTDGTQTGSDGKFTISVPNKKGLTLEFRFIGYAGQTIAIGSSSVINVSLAADNRQLSEVVVTALNIEQSRDKLTSAQSTIKGSDIEQSGEVSVLNGLEGKASGLSILSTSGDPGAATQVMIRGQNSISNGTNPLFVIDGVPVSNSSFGGNLGGTAQESRMSDINPDDIASTEIIKGAQGAALYGTQGYNGVILITTKKGKNTNGKINISLDNTYDLDVLNKSVPLQQVFGQGDQGKYAQNSRYSWGDIIAQRSGGPDTYNPAGAFVYFADGTRRGQIAPGTTANPHGGKNSTQLFNHSTDLFHTGDFLDQTISLSGGDDKTTFNTSLENLGQDGSLVTGSNYFRKAFHTAVSRNFGDNVKVTTTFGYSNIASARAQQGSNTSGIFLGGLRSPVDFDYSNYIGTYVDASGNTFPDRQVAYRNALGSSNSAIYDNPLWILNNVTSTTRVNRMFGSFEVSVTATPWLSFIERAGVDYNSDDRTDNLPTVSASSPGGSLTIQEISEQTVNNDLIASFNKNINKDITFNGLLGFNYNNYLNENIGATVKNFTLPNAPFNLGNSAGDARVPFNSNEELRSVASYAKVSFGLYDQVFVDATERIEQSSTYTGSFNFPSIGLGWQFTKLKPFDGNKILTFGKIRGSYGVVGIPPNPYQSSTYYNPLTIAEDYGSALDASSSVYGGGYTRSTTKGNAFLTPESKKEYEIGADFRFFNDRITLGGTYYSNKNNTAIFSVSTDPTTGYLNEQANAASISNKGIELDLGVTWYKKGNWSFVSSANFSHNANLVNSLSGTQQYGIAGFTAVVSSDVPGYPSGVFWGPGFAKNANGSYVLDANGFPEASATSSVLGNPNPQWHGGVTNMLRYKHWNFSFLIDHVQGGQVWNGTKAALATIGTAGFTGSITTYPTALKDISGVTIPANTPFRGSVRDFGAGPVALDEAWYNTNGLGGGFGTATDPIYFENGTRTRLREVSLGWTLTGEKFKRITKFQSVDFSVTGRNLFLITGYTGIDPETNLSGTAGQGIDYFNNPSTRSYLFKIKINY